MDYELKEDEEPEVKESIMEIIKKNDPFELRLKPISIDKCRDLLILDKHLPTSWILKTFGDDIETSDLSGTVQNESVIQVKSLIWPGAYTTFHKGKYFNVYFGGFY